MVKNTKGGKGFKKGKKNHGTSKRALVLPEKNQVLAKVEQCYGNGRYECLGTDKRSRKGHKCGRMRRGGAINRVFKGDIVLIQIREYQADKVDIIHKYTLEEQRALQKRGLLEGLAVQDDYCEEETEDQEEKTRLDIQDILAQLSESEGEDESSSEESDLEEYIDEL